MDLISVGFYAVICGSLSVLAPNFGNAAIRMGVGAVVGIAAAIILPMIRSSMGY